MLMAEVGVENISTNMICARAQMTPPALYRYFKDKYAVIEALSERQMARQFAVIQAWLNEHVMASTDAFAANIEDLLRQLSAVTTSQEGSIWVQRAVRAAPRLAAVRQAARRRMTESLVEVYRPLYPDLADERLRCRIQIGVEFCAAMDELIAESEPEVAEILLKECAQVIGNVFSRPLTA